jgi:DNA invertase Pin-like site-specific DNA recombinase
MHNGFAPAGERNMTATKALAVAYYRTSSAANVGDDKDSLKRQQDAVRAYAKAHRMDVVKEFYDAAVSGADPVEARAGFSEMLAYMLGNGARTVLVESASRFARDVLVQLLGHALLKKHGIALVPVDAPGHFTEETPTAVMLRTIMGSVSQFEKEALVARLRKARDRKSAELGRRIEGNPAFKNQGPPAAVVKAAKAIRARDRAVSLREIARRLAKRGMLAPSGKPYGAESVARMLAKKR